MPKAKIAVTLEAKTVDRLDQLVRAEFFENRSQAVEQAVAEKIARIDKTRLARESAKLRPAEEKALAEEGMAGDSAAWPEF